MSVVLFFVSNYVCGVSEISFKTFFVYILHLSSFMNYYLNLCVNILALNGNSCAV